MNLRHLKALCEIVEQGLHLSNAAHRLHRSQPALTRQIQQLERELGVTLFERNHQRLVRLTDEGQAVLEIAQRIVSETHDIGEVVKERLNAAQGELRVATTHTQARYTLLPVIQGFMARYRGVTLSLKQGTPLQCCDMVARGQADIAVCTDTGPRDDIVQIPCYLQERLVITPPRHPLLREKPLTLQAIARYPIITYAEGVPGRAVVMRAFQDAGLDPQVLLSAIDADLSKAYVELGLGVAILFRAAFDVRRDKPLRGLDGSHLFPSSRLNVVIRPHAYLRGYTLAFIQMFAPGLPSSEVRTAVNGGLARGPTRELPVL
jgi:LysR family cys regulon transcriptional activator